MKRTIDEIYNIIIEKRDNAESHLERNGGITKANCIDEKGYPLLRTGLELKGEILAYTDVLCLIESSQILKEDK